VLHRRVNKRLLVNREEQRVSSTQEPTSLRDDHEQHVGVAPSPIGGHALVRLKTSRYDPQGVFRTNVEQYCNDETD
jgi:hypothetical protein